VKVKKLENRKNLFLLMKKTVKNVSKKKKRRKKIHHENHDMVDKKMRKSVNSKENGNYITYMFSLN